MDKSGKCLTDLIASGRFKKDVINQIAESPDGLDVINTMLGNAKRQRREAAIQALRVDQAWRNIEGFKGDKSQALMALLVKDTGTKGGNKAGYANVESRQKYHENRYHSMLAKFLEAHHSRLKASIGSPVAYNEEGLNKVVKALFGEEVDDGAIKGFGDDLRKVFEQMRDDFNEMGGSIPENERWVMPQNHDARTIRKLGKDALRKGASEAEIKDKAKELWMADIEQWLDPKMMTDDYGNALSREDLLEGLDYAFESIYTGGLNKAKDLSAPVKLGKKLARKHSERRFLFFKDADSWTAYHNKYGKGDIFQTLVSHVNTMAHDIANMEVLGPNPNTTFETLLQQVEKVEGRLPGRKKAMLEAVYKVVSGSVDQGHMTTLADFMQSTRNVITASKLGRAILSAVSDEGFTGITAKYNNLSYTKILQTKTALMTDKELQTFAVRMGLGAENWTKIANASNRYGDVYGTGMTAKWAEAVMRTSGLEPWTNAGRKAFTMEYAGYLADQFGKTLEELKPKTKRAFESVGITEADWDAFRQTDLLDFKGAKYADVLAEGGDKFHQLIMEEVDYAVPTPDARVRAMTTGGIGTGTVTGQMVRSITNLKSFPITLVTTHLYRLAYQASWADRAAYGGMMLASTTLLGAFAMQAKDVTSGREHRPGALSFDDPAQMMQFWGAAMLQGGGLGIFGDFLFTDQNRFGGEFTSTLFGPTGQLVNSAIGLTVGNAQQLGKGEDTNIGAEALKFVEQNTPSIWQIHPLKAAMFDQLELILDPKAEKRFARARKNRQKEYGQDYWWKPGEALPEFAQ